jgi:hypothetical protein
MAPATHSRPFPHSSLLASYEECARFAQAYLQIFAYGDLKPWAASRQPSLNYRSLITFKNGKMGKPVPQIVKRILEENGFLTQRVNSYIEANKRVIYFQFPSKEKFLEFKKKLKEIINIRVAG